MNDKRYRYILYTITLVVIATIGIQVYWNYKNYLTNRQQLINDVQVSLDKAVDDYYADLAHKTTLGFSFNDITRERVSDKRGAFVKILSNINTKNGEIRNLDSVHVNRIEDVKVFRGFKADSMMLDFRLKNEVISTDTIKNSIRNIKKGNDSLDVSNIQLLTSKIIVSINNDTLNLKKVDSILKTELLRKSISVDYTLNYRENSHDRSFHKKPIERVTDSLTSLKKQNTQCFF